MCEQESRRVALEMAAYRYTRALEVGDHDTIAAILLEAEHDAELEQIILEINDALAAEMEDAVTREDVVLVRELARTYLPSGVPQEMEPSVPPLTVGDVIARIRTDATLRGEIEREVANLARQLHSNETPLPDDLSQRSVKQLLEQFGISVSARFQKLFRETAIFLSMGRNQGMARLAATRRQQARYTTGQERKADQDRKSDQERKADQEHE